MISAFGPEAIRYSQLMADVDAVVAEPGYLLNAYVEAVRRHAAGESFYGMLLVEEAHDRTMSMFAGAVLREDPDHDHVRSTLNGIASGGVKVNGKPGNEWLAEADIVDPTLRSASREFLLLSPALLVRSHMEYARVSTLWPNRRRHYELILAEHELPAVERRPALRPGVVLWAPERFAPALALTAFGLAEIHGDVTIVSADGIVPLGSNAIAYAAGDPRILAALSTATCVVVPNPTDPGAAVAFARRGYGVVATVSSGAHEYVENAQLYDPAVLRQLHVAAMMALSQPASLRELPPPPPRAPSAPVLPVMAADAPPATIVVPTFNRRDDLGRCLECIAAQTYPNVRAVVVNDAGVAIDDIVARFPFAVLLDLKQNVGVSQACMEGLKLVDDGFVTFFSDDDLLYPNHVERLAGAMLRSGAALAHGNTLIRYVERTEHGTFRTTGFNCVTFIDTSTPSEALISTPISGHSILWRRSLFNEIGGWLVESMLSDQEIQMRAAQRYDFAYVDEVLAEWRIHGDNFSGKVNASDEQRRIFEVVHPTPDRPWLNKTRAFILTEMANRPPGYVFEPSLKLTP